ncbi:MAG: DUF3810 domain-containing protein [Planctomycetota bacterium]
MGEPVDVEREDVPEERRRPRLVRALGCPLTAALASVLAHSAPGAVESLYSRGLYPHIARLVAVPSGWLADVAPDGPALLATRVSLGELLLAATVAGAILLLVRALRRGLVPLLSTALLLLGAAAWAFLGLWGLNYAREPLSARLGLDPGPPAEGQLFSMALRFGNELERGLDALGPDWADGVDFADEARRAWASAVQEEPSLGHATEPTVVAPLASPLLAAAGITGIFGPFSQEAHVVGGLVPLDRGFGACHEIAHLQGWAREDEANFLAYRVAVRHGSEALGVCGHAGALRHTLRALRKENRVLWSVAVDALDERILALFEGRRVHWEARRNERVSEAASRVNDAYLRTNAQADGIASYGRMVDLLAAEQRAQGASATVGTDGWNEREERNR